MKNKSQKTALRIAHIALGSFWLAGLIAMLFCLVMPADMADEQALVFYHAIDEWLVIPCAVTAVITGLVLVKVNHEYFLSREKWLSLKLIICCSVMLGGYFFVKTPLLSWLVNFILTPFSVQMEERTLFIALTIVAILFILVVFHLSIVKSKSLLLRKPKSPQELSKQRSNYEQSLKDFTKPNTPTLVHNQPISLDKNIRKER